MVLPASLTRQRAQMPITDLPGKARAVRRTADSDADPAVHRRGAAVPMAAGEGCVSEFDPLSSITLRVVD